MRSPEQAAVAWHKTKSFFRKHKPLDALRASVRADPDRFIPLITQDGVRSTFWKAFLLFRTTETSEWPKILVSSRSAYSAVREHSTQEAEAFVDGQAYHISEVEDLREAIRIDVERLLPNNLYFEQPETRAMMNSILFVFCRLNSDLGYRQGMHELLAPIVWVVERDAIELGHSSKAVGEDVVIRAMFDAEFIEHDAFALFCQVMQSAKGFYEQTTHSGADNPIVIKSRRVFDELLPIASPKLATHLNAFDVVPQVFLIRWIRVLFVRELSFDESLLVWDMLFAIDPLLELVDYLCVLLLQRMQSKLLAADDYGTLMMLLQKSEPDERFDAAKFALDAAQLRDECDHLQATKDAELIERRNTPPALQRNITTFSGGLLPPVSTPSPSHRTRQVRNFEDMLQTTAKSIYAQSEKFGIGRAVRSAIDEVHRKALEIRDAQDSSANGRDDDMRTRIESLEKRQVQLGELLGGVVEELWDYYKLAADTAHSDASKPDSIARVENLKHTIARVQLVQVFLQGSNLPLADRDTFFDNRVKDLNDTAGHETDVARNPIVECKEDHSVGRKEEHPIDDIHHDNNNDGDDTAIRETSPASLVMTRLERDPVSEPVNEEDLNTSMPPAPSPSHPIRPPLAESSFSWMLGQDKENAPFSPGAVNNHVISPSIASVENSQLFPSGTDSANATGNTPPKVRAGRKRIRKQVVFSTSTPTADDPFNETGLTH